MAGFSSGSPYVSPGQIVKTPGGTLTDPYNWKGIAANLKKEQTNKASAQKRIKAAAQTPQAVQQAAPAAPAPTVKELLDAYRAMNGGALPPGTTPEMAAMIDQGIWNDWSMLEGNPQLAQALLGFQGAIGALPAEYEAAKAKVAGQYENLTGDVLQSGATWMKDLYGRIVDPNDPNAALAQQDPALTGYANTMSQIDETADLNQATDMAWFDKMLQNQLANYQMTMRTAGMDPGLAAGGSGGGGGGGRGGGGGGGGSGDSDWSDPKTVATSLDELKGVGQNVNAGYNLDFWNGLIAGARNPEEEDFFRSMFNTYRAQPISVAAGLEKELTAAEAKQKELQAQATARVAYEDIIPARTAADIEKRRSNLGNYIFADDPSTESKKKVWFQDPEVAATPQTAEQAEFNVHAQEVENLQKQANMNMVQAAFGKFLGKTGFGKMGGKTPIKEEAKGKVRTAQEAWDKQELLAAQDEWKKTNLTGTPWDWSTWSGYIDPVDEEGQRQNETRLDYIRRMRALTEEYNPNVAPQNVKSTYTDTATQSNKAQTTQNSYDPLNSVGPNLQDQTTAYPDQYFMPGGITPAQDLIQGGADMDFYGIAGESRGAGGLTDLSRIAAQRLGAQPNISVMGKALGSTKPKAKPLKAPETISVMGKSLKKPTKPAKKASAIKVTKDLFKKPVKKTAAKKKSTGSKTVKAV